MKPVRVVSGAVAPLDRASVDTDQIVPKQFLKRIERSGFGEFLFYDWMQQADFPLLWPEYHGAPILAAGTNGIILSANEKTLYVTTGPTLTAFDAEPDGALTHQREFAKLVWRTASPKWHFDDATFDRSAASFDNPDHVEIVIHNYRWRLGLADGQAENDDLEERLAGGPVITVPTITLEGDANGAPHPDPSSYAGKFSGPYSHRTIEGGIGHNLPQEAPEAFAKAVIEVDA